MSAVAPEPVAVPSAPALPLWKRWLQSREMGVLAGVVALCSLMALLSPETFLSEANLRNLSRQVALLGIFALGEAVVIISGGIDLSVGSLIALSGVLCAMGLVWWNWPLWAAIALPLGISLAIGGLHAWLIAVWNLPPFIATLGTLSMLRSLTLLLTSSLPIAVAGREAFVFLGNGQWAGVPVPVWVFLGETLLLALLLQRTALGRQIYALGGNEEATRLSGVPVRRVKGVAYSLCSLLAGLAGVLYAAYLRQGDPSHGVGYELSAIAAAVVGGCSLSGGVGSVAGTVLGATLLSVVINGINLTIKRNASLWEGFIVGLVVVGVAAFNLLRRRSS